MHLLTIHVEYENINFHTLYRYDTVVKDGGDNGVPAGVARPTARVDLITTKVTVGPLSQYNYNDCNKIVLVLMIDQVREKVTNS